jgi:hypothetical protein
MIDSCHDLDELPARGSIDPRPDNERIRAPRSEDEGR